MRNRRKKPALAPLLEGPARVITYARVSSEGQKERETIESQRPELVRMFAGLPDATLVRAIEDDGVSGETITDRPGFSLVMKLAQERAYDVLMVTKADRLTRSKRAGDCAKIVDDLGDSNITIIAGGTRFDLTNPEQRLHLVMLMSFSSLDKHQILKNTWGGRVTALKSNRAKVHGSDPFGFTFVPDGSGRRNRGTYALNPVQADAIRMMVRMCLAGRPVVDICEALDNANIPPPRGPQIADDMPSWGKSSVRYILRNPIIKGEYEVLSGEHVIKVPAIVDDETWMRVQAALTSRHRVRPPSRERSAFLLAGHIKCGICEYSLATNKNHAGVRYYRCTGRNQWRELRREAPCTMPSIRADELDERFWLELRSIVSSSEMLTRCASLETEHVEAGKSLRSEIELWSRRLVKLDELRQGTLDFWRSKILTKEECERELAKTDQERKRVERDIEIARGKIANSGDMVAWLSHIDRVSKEWEHLLDTASFEERVAVVSLVFPKGKGSVVVRADGSTKATGVLFRGEQELTFEFESQLRKSA